MIPGDGDHRSMKDEQIDYTLINVENTTSDSDLIEPATNDEHKGDRQTVRMMNSLPQQV